MLLEEALVFSVAKLLAEGAGGAGFGIGMRKFDLLLSGRGGGGVGNKNRGRRLSGGGFKIPEALYDFCLAELVHHGKRYVDISG